MNRTSICGNERMSGRNIHQRYLYRRALFSENFEAQARTKVEKPKPFFLTKYLGLFVVLFLVILAFTFFFIEGNIISFRGEQLWAMQTTASSTKYASHELLKEVREGNRKNIKSLSKYLSLTDALAWKDIGQFFNQIIREHLKKFGEKQWVGKCVRVSFRRAKNRNVENLLFGKKDIRKNSRTDIGPDDSFRNSLEENTKFTIGSKTFEYQSSPAGAFNSGGYITIACGNNWADRIDSIFNISNEDMNDIVLITVDWFTFSSNSKTFTNFAISSTNSFGDSFITTLSVHTVSTTEKRQDESIKRYITFVFFLILQLVFLSYHLYLIIKKVLFSISNYRSSEKIWKMFFKPWNVLIFCQLILLVIICILWGIKEGKYKSSEDIISLTFLKKFQKEFNVEIMNSLTQFVISTYNLENVLFNFYAIYSIGILCILLIYMNSIIGCLAPTVVNDAILRTTMLICAFILFSFVCLGILILTSQLIHIVPLMNNTIFYENNKTHYYSPSPLEFIAFFVGGLEKVIFRQSETYREETALLCIAVLFFVIFFIYIASSVFITILFKLFADSYGGIKDYTQYENQVSQK